jgi:hypothetical protein
VTAGIRAPPKKSMTQSIRMTKIKLDEKGMGIPVAEAMTPKNKQKFRECLPVYPP